MRLPKKVEDKLREKVFRVISTFGKKEIRGLSYKLNYAEAENLTDKFMKVVLFIFDFVTIFAFAIAFFVIAPKMGLSWERIQTGILFLILVQVFFILRKKS